MIPLALGLREGTELLRPMAVGVMGGLVFSVFLTLLFLPALYLLFAGRPERTTEEQV
jgi:multidrug efflux pump subunit AcrB